MATSKPKQTSARGKTRSEIHLGAAEVPRIYANNLNLTVTPFDFRLTFGEVLVADEEKLEILDKAVINMSPQHAKAVVAVLERNVRKYEKAYGTIPAKEEAVLLAEQEEGKA